MTTKLIRGHGQLWLSIVVLATLFNGNDIWARTVMNALNTPSNLSGAHIQNHFITVNGLRVHYVEFGKGRTVVLIHGNAGSVEDFEFGAFDFLSPGYRVVAIDRPGHGRSDRPPGNSAVEFQAALLHQTLSQLGIFQPILVGHSWGAALALAYALRYPADVSAMILLAPAAYPDESSEGFLPFTTKIPLIGDLSVVLGRALLGHRLLRAGLTRAFYPSPISDRYLKFVDSLWLGRKQIKAYVEDEATLNDSLRKLSIRYSEINIPVVIVTGDKDRIVSPDQNARALHAAIRDSRLIEMKDTGHEIPQTHPESIGLALRMIS